ncbi:MAG: penicillin-binding transpeptidase domain-containing protein [Anaerolineae bacterium]|nr:penicillin-binding transpeptidase domain-containing protein [Thermoflexales bacterium]MDW8396030.1 penicillin-binding transpeptidase domain-containing protein [Anaerolineae bacterium]
MVLLVGVFACGLSACVQATPEPTPLVQTPTPTAPPLTQAAEVASRFVAALNAQDFSQAFTLLVPRAQTALGGAEAIAEAYLAVQSLAHAQPVQAEMQGGLVWREDGYASVALVTTWHSAVVGTFTTTGTLTLAPYRSGERWGVAWTRDALLNGLEGGRLELRLDVPRRGRILAVDGTPLADQVAVEVIGVQRGLIADEAQEQALLELLAQVTGLPQPTIRAKYANQPENWFVPIAEVPSEVIDAYDSEIQRIPAIVLRQETVRRYPDPALAPHVIGYVGPIPAEQLGAYRARGYQGNERVGVAGIEAALDDELAGRFGGDLLLFSPRNSQVLARTPAQHGRDVTLTLSPTLQRTAQDLLGNRRGTIVVLRPEDGAVLAMASAPAFQIGALTQRDIRTGALLNRATQGQYPPGSVFKIITLAAGLSEGAVASPGEIFFDPGYWDGYGRAARQVCWLRGGHGRISLQNGLSASCNVVFYELGKRLYALEPSVLSVYARRFGLGEVTGLELPEAKGLVPDPDWKRRVRGEPWLGGDVVNMAIGQGEMLVTPLQVARMTAVVANGGVLVQPHLVEGAAPLMPVGHVGLDRLTMRALREGMVGAVHDTRYGTAAPAFRGFDYCFDAAQRLVRCGALPARERRAARRLLVAGKTGTAQAGGALKPFAWFTAFAPADAPEIVVTVLLENSGEGSVQAAPLARALLEAYFGLSKRD